MATRLASDRTPPLHATTRRHHAGETSQGCREKISDFWHKIPGKQHSRQAARLHAPGPVVLASGSSTPWRKDLLR